MHSKIFTNTFPPILQPTKETIFQVTEMHYYAKRMNCPYYKPCILTIVWLRISFNLNFTGPFFVVLFENKNYYLPLAVPSGRAV
jgi:hypothetical protein